MESPNLDDPPRKTKSQPARPIVAALIVFSPIAIAVIWLVCYVLLNKIK